MDRAASQMIRALLQLNGTRGLNGLLAILDSTFERVDSMEIWETGGTLLNESRQEYKVLTYREIFMLLLPSKICIFFRKG